MTKQQYVSSLPWPNKIFLIQIQRLIEKDIWPFILWISNWSYCLTSPCCCVCAFYWPPITLRPSQLRENCPCGSNGGDCRKNEIQVNAETSGLLIAPPRCSSLGLHTSKQYSMCLQSNSLRGHSNIRQCLVHPFLHLLIFKLSSFMPAIGSYNVPLIRGAPKLASCARTWCFLPVTKRMVLW